MTPAELGLMVSVINFLGIAITVFSVRRVKVNTDGKLDRLAGAMETLATALTASAAQTKGSPEETALAVAKAAADIAKARQSTHL